jgi:uncharacterized Zn-finger protein
MSQEAKNDNAVILGEKDLPAFCPNKSMPIWSSHPRVFLDFDADHQARCPYCSTVYQLAPGVSAHGH